MKYATNEQQKELYSEEFAKSFNSHRINSNHMYKIEAIDSFFQPKDDHSVICEFGAGTGIHANYILQMHSHQIAKYYFVDLSEHMINIAKKTLQKFDPITEFFVREAEIYEPKIHDVDFLFCNGAMHHFQSPCQAINTFNKYLKPDGVLVICEPQITCPYAFPRVIFQPIEYGQFRVRPHTVMQWLQQNGFTIIGSRYLHYRSNSKLFRFVVNFEKIKFLNFMSVMFLIAATKRL